MSSTTTSLQLLLSKLSIPQGFTRRDDSESIPEPDALVALETWRRNAFADLSELRAYLDARDKLSLDEQGQVVAVAATFDGEGAWVLPTTQALALGTSRDSFTCLRSLTANYHRHFGPS